MKPRSKHVKRIIPTQRARSVYGHTRFHTGTGPLIMGKPEYGQVICFTHQTAQHICHCNSHDQIKVGTRTRIPRKGHHAAWNALRRHLAPLVKARVKANDELTRQAYASTVPGFEPHYHNLRYRGYQKSDKELVKTVS